MDERAERLILVMGMVATALGLAVVWAIPLIDVWLEVAR